MNNLKRLFIYRKKLVLPYFDVLLKWLDRVAVVASALLLATIVFEYGFFVSFDEYEIIGAVYKFAWYAFIIKSLAHLIIKFKDTIGGYGKLAWVMTWLLYLTFIPVFFASPKAGVMYGLWHFLDGGLYHSLVLTILSFLTLSDWLVKLLGKRISPSLIFAFSFLIIIFIGAGLLMLPKATYDGGITFIDALFTSTSATCVTGLTTVDVSTVFTPIGVFVIMILIQIGGLGVMTITSFFALFFMGNTSLCNQSLISEMVSSKSLNSLLSTLLYIFGFTAVIEIVGAVCIFMDIHGSLGMSLSEEIFFSVFHSISAFCNAGFSTLSGNLGNEMVMSGHNVFYMVITFLIILGGIGFPILVNMFDWLKYLIKRVKFSVRNTFVYERRVHIYDINTKIAVAMTVVLLVVGTILIGVLEWNSAFAGMPVMDKCVQAFFTAACPRTAGFASVSMGSFTVQTILLLIFLMVIGGGAQSTAGGLKVNAFAVILLNIKSIICGNDRVTVFNRELSTDSIRRSNSTLVLYILFVFIAIFLMSIFEPDAPLMSIVFEAISALSTVGSSLDLTPTLGAESKVLVIVLMFIGRVGVLTIMASIVKQHKNNNVEFTSGNIILN